MTTQFAFRTVALVAILAFLAGCLAAVAGAQEPVPAPTQRTVVAAGTGLARVTPKDRDSNASIVAAVDAAGKKALPLAFADAREQATELAQQAGVALGALLTISNAQSAGGIFYGPYAYGSFGPDTYCGSVRTRSVTVGKDGKRRYGKYRTHDVCRFPSTLQRSVQLTYAVG
ncbi:MAG: hypothetical protein JWQ18_1765 [Conexibacter sp.]|nr:hypothetical protein [Conexibacter sp.]